MTEEVKSKGNLVTVVAPQFLTVVGSPANKTAFKVVRSAQGENQVTKPRIVKRAKRTDAPSPILRLVFPEGHTDETVTQQLSAFGLSGYDVVTGEGGIVTATRSDLKTFANDDTVQAIQLTADGIVAMVAKRSDEVSENPKNSLTVTSLSFSSQSFDSASVGEWLSKHSVDAAEVEEGESSFIVKRHDVPEGEESRVVTLEDGVTATVVRSDTQDIPAAFVYAVNECAYGHWGWGQLDFTAKLADKQFCNAADDAIWTLRSVLDDILLYSSLPLAERKTLVHESLKQFGAYMDTILDNLPRQVLVAVVRSANPQPKQEEESMKNATTTATPAAAEGDDTKPVTRADLKALTAEIVAATVEAMAKRSEPASANTEANAGAEEKTEEASTEGTSITRADMKGLLDEALAPVVERIARVEGTAVVRSDLPDGAAVTVAEGGEAKDGKKKDVFRGAKAFSGLGLSGARK